MTYQNRTRQVHISIPNDKEVFTLNHNAKPYLSSEARLRCNECLLLFYEIIVGLDHRPNIILGLDYSKLAVQKINFDTKVYAG